MRVIAAVCQAWRDIDEHRGIRGSASRALRTAVDMLLVSLILVIQITMSSFCIALVSSSTLVGAAA